MDGVAVFARDEFGATAVEATFSRPFHWKFLSVRSEQVIHCLVIDFDIRQPQKSLVVAPERVQNVSRRSLNNSLTVNRLSFLLNALF